MYRNTLGARRGEAPFDYLELASLPSIKRGWCRLSILTIQFLLARIIYNHTLLTFPEMSFILRIPNDVAGSAIPAIFGRAFAAFGGVIFVPYIRALTGMAKAPGEHP